MLKKIRLAVRLELAVEVLVEERLGLEVVAEGEQHGLESDRRGGGDGRGARRLVRAEPGTENLADLAAGLEEAALDRGDGRLGNGRDLVVAQVLVLAQHDDLAIRGRELGEGAADEIRLLALEEVGEGRRALPWWLRRVRRKANLAAPLAEHVETLVAGNREQPRLERCRGQEPLPVLVGPRERLLEHVLGHGSVEQHLGAVGIHGRLVAIVESDEGKFVAAAEGLDEGIVR